MPLPTATEYPGLPGSEYDWAPTDPTAAAIARKAQAAYAKQFDVVSNSRAAANELIQAAAKFLESLGYVEAFNMTLRANLYPFPGPGGLADVGVLELRAALAAAQATIVFLNTPITVEDVGAVTPLTALRRIA